MIDDIIEEWENKRKSNLEGIFLILLTVVVLILVVVCAYFINRSKFLNYYNSAWIHDEGNVHSELAIGEKGGDFVIQIKYPNGSQIYFSGVVESETQLMCLESDWSEFRSYPTMFIQVHLTKDSLTLTGLPKTFYPEETTWLRKESHYAED